MTSDTTLPRQTELLAGPTDDDLDAWTSLPARQQPAWEDRELVAQLREELAGLPALVAERDVRTLRNVLAEVASGNFQVVQAGDCAEDPAESTPGHIARKTGLLDALAGVMKTNSGKPVVRVGRIAGQFAKPRSRPTERHGEVELPVYRGHMVNSPDPDPELRRPDPKRVLLGYWSASATMDLLRRPAPEVDPSVEAPVWTSHEALLLDYELPMLRRDMHGRLVLGSTHWPWIGDRTRQPDGAHVAMLSAVANPVACKVGPSMSPEELVRLCALLDPEREPGRLTLIARMGVDKVTEALPPLVAAVRKAGHPAIWMCDPMHGNTVPGPDGLKTRFIGSVIREVEQFQHVVTGESAVAGGLHLETTPDHVTECVAAETELPDLGSNYTSLCDPRLNSEQALVVTSAWRG